MNIGQIIAIAVGLAMDATAAGICIGLSDSKINAKKALIVGLYFGSFQAIMPLMGFVAAGFVGDRFMSHGNIIAFAILSFIGGKMLFDSYKLRNGDSAEVHPSLRWTKMIPLALATSIDALAVGASMALLEINITLAVMIIGAVTFTLAALGAKLGSRLGNKYRTLAVFVGGVVLIFMGILLLL